MDQRAWSGLALAAFAGLFGLAMTFAAKSFDRYLLPAFPPLDLLAGLGLSLSLARLRWIGGAGWLLAAAFILPLLIYPLAGSLPYALDWYNPLAGGGPAARRLLAVGWGEGLDQVARYLNGKPNAERLKVALPGEIYTTVLDAQFVGQVMPAEGGDPSANDATYYVTYIRAQQDGPPAYDPAYENWEPELTVRLAGVDVARVYSAAVGVPLGALFGNQARLEGYGIDTLLARSGRPLGVKLFWRALSAEAANARVTLSLTDAAGQEMTRVESQFGAAELGQVRSRGYQLQLPAGLAAGEYRLWVSMQDAAGRPVLLSGRPTFQATGVPEAREQVVLRSLLIGGR